LAAIVMPLDFMVMGAYAWLAAQGAARVKNHWRWLDGLAGALFSWVALRLLLA